MFVKQTYLGFTFDTGSKITLNRIIGHWLTWSGVYTCKTEFVKTYRICLIFLKGYYHKDFSVEQQK